MSKNKDNIKLLLGINARLYNHLIVHEVNTPEGIRYQINSKDQGILNQLATDLNNVGIKGSDGRKKQVFSSSDGGSYIVLRPENIPLLTIGSFLRLQGDQYKDLAIEAVNTPEGFRYQINSKDQGILNQLATDLNNLGVKGSDGRKKQVFSSSDGGSYILLRPENIDLLKDKLDKLIEEKRKQPINNEPVAKIETKIRPRTEKDKIIRLIGIEAQANIKYNGDTKLYEAECKDEKNATFLYDKLVRTGGKDNVLRQSNIVSFSNDHVMSYSAEIKSPYAPLIGIHQVKQMFPGYQVSQNKGNFLISHENKSSMENLIVDLKSQCNIATQLTDNEKLIGRDPRQKNPKQIYSIILTETDIQNLDSKAKFSSPDNSKGKS